MPLRRAKILDHLIKEIQMGPRREMPLRRGQKNRIGDRFCHKKSEKRFHKIPFREAPDRKVKKRPLSGKLFYLLAQRFVGGRHGIGAHLFRKNPGQLLPLKRLRLALPRSAQVKGHEKMKRFVSIRNEG